MTEQELRNRLYAVNLMNRADVVFDVRDIAIATKLINLIEADFSVWLSAWLRGTVAHAQIVSAIRAGSHRPELPPMKPVAASLEGNLK